MDESKRIVILGKTGSGKTSLANTIFGEELFTIEHSINSQTKQCQTENKSVNGRKITLIDTPGFFDTDMSEGELKPEIVRCITECAPGPHAFLIVLKVEKFTEQEKAVIDKICEYFSEDALKYAVIVFTHGDMLPKGMKIEKFISQNKNLSDLMEKCGNRCHIFDNTYWKNDQQNNYRSNQFQVEELLKTIDQTVLANNGGCYTNEMLQAVEAEIQQEEECVRQSSENMSKKEIRWQAIRRTFKKLMIKLAGVTTGALLGAVFGVVVMVGIVATVLISSSVSLVNLHHVAKTTGTLAGGTAGAAGTSLTTLACVATATFAAAGAVKGGLIGYKAAKGADTVQEAIKRPAEAVYDEAQSVLVKANDVVKSLLQPKSKQCQNLK
ncbi:GTPase IMAP family member 7-like [Channa argus]|uniref:GTPase IMAP family member 7-like n=1 Tax=Channa argus TaxID=215402 RepID=UPI0035218A30